MSNSTNSQMMDTEPGGENTQYESLNNFNRPHAKDEGQFGDSAETEVTEQVQKDKLAREEKTAENMRYGEAISEHGFGGETTTSTGSAEQGGYGRIEGTEKTPDAAQMRTAQGYGKGSGVGA